MHKGDNKDNKNNNNNNNNVVEVETNEIDKFCFYL
jgi:hypothetical protein